MVGSINSHRVMYYLWVFDVLSSFCFLSAQYCQFSQSHSPLCSFKKLSLCTRNKIKNLTKPINRTHHITFSAAKVVFFYNTSKFCSEKIHPDTKLCHVLFTMYNLQFVTVGKKLRHVLFTMYNLQFVKTATNCTRSALWDACVTTWSKNFTNTTHSEAYTSGGKIFAHNALKHVKEILYGRLQLVKVVPDSFKYQISVNFKITVGNAVPHSYDILPRYFRTF